MTRTPIPNCPQEDKPIRDRAWTDGQRPEPKYSDAEIGKKLRRLSAEMRNELCGDFADKLDAILVSLQSTPDKAGVSDAVDRLREIAYRDEAKSVTVRADDLRAALAHFASQSAEAVRDGDGQTLPPGWRIEVRENAGALGLCVFGPVGSFAVDGETSHKSDIRADVIRELRAAMQEQSHD